MASPFACPLVRSLAAGLSAVVLALSVVGCDTRPRPDVFVSADSMVTILYDLHMAYALTTTVRMTGENPTLKPWARVKTALAFESVAKKHGLTAEQFDQNLTYYLAEPAEADTIWKRVVVRLEEAQARMAQDAQRRALEPPAKPAAEPAKPVPAQPTPEQRAQELKRRQEAEAQKARQEKRKQQIEERRRAAKTQPPASQ